MGEIAFLYLRTIITFREVATKPYLASNYFKKPQKFQYYIIYDL